MLIRNAEIYGRGSGDLRCENGKIAEIGTLAPYPGERVFDANGGALLPGLHDHHIHLAGLAARRNSVSCGPPDVQDADGLAAALCLPGNGWIRGVGFHESVLGGFPDAPALDRLVADRPLRMQHRTGRMWFFNSLGLRTLLASAKAPPGLEREGQRFTGRLFDEDAWLQHALAGMPPDLAEVSAELARYGVTGITDMSPSNGGVIANHIAAQRANGRLHQNVILAGTLSLAESVPVLWELGPFKLHLHEADLPPFDEAVTTIRAAHGQGRGVAVHCVTEVELVFTLALFEVAGAIRGDRIEHASVASPGLVARVADLKLQACVQPHFIAERGDRYLLDVEARHHPDLYRLRSFVEAGVPLAGGSDAPYGSADPWTAIAAAVSRTTSSGTVIGEREALTQEEALGLYLADPKDLTRQRKLAVGEAADLCLLDRSWAQARTLLSREAVARTFINGALVHDDVDKSPIQRLPGA